MRGRRQILRAVLLASIAVAPWSLAQPTVQPAGNRRLGGGSIVADKWGLATIRQLRMLKGAQRVVIQRQ